MDMDMENPSNLGGVSLMLLLVALKLYRRLNVKSSWIGSANDDNDDDDNDDDDDDENIELKQTSIASTIFILLLTNWGMQDAVI